MNPSAKELAIEMRRLVDSRMREFDASMSDAAARSNWLGPCRDVLLRWECREALRSMLRVELRNLMVGLATAFDGATAMMDGGRAPRLVDWEGKPIEDELLWLVIDHLDQP